MDMKLIDELNGNVVLLKKFSTLMYFMNKEVARNDFSDFLEFCNISEEEWNIFKSWLNDNGLSTYN